MKWRSLVMDARSIDPASERHHRAKRGALYKGLFARALTRSAPISRPRLSTAVGGHFSPRHSFSSGASSVIGVERIELINCFSLLIEKDGPRS